MKQAAAWQMIETNGVRLHVLAAGPLGGPLVVLLHGFPEFWYGWHRQVPALVAAGYRVLVPDQRGYNRSAKPRGLGAYQATTLAADVAGLIRAAGRDQAAVVGHDWGGMVAWHLALQQPAAVSRLVVLNCPHPAVFARHLREDAAQQRRSLYVLFFQLPGLPEWGLRFANYRSLASGLQSTSRPGTFSAADLARYRRAWARPGAITAMLNWYRAALRRPASPPADPQVAVPTLVIWGARDPFLGVAMAGESRDLCAAGELVTLPEAGHWVQHEAAARVNALLLDFLGRGAGA